MSNFVPYPLFLFFLISVFFSFEWEIGCPTGHLSPFGPRPSRSPAGSNPNPRSVSPVFPLAAPPGEPRSIHLSHLSFSSSRAIREGEQRPSHLPLLRSPALIRSSAPPPCHGAPSAGESTLPPCPPLQFTAPPSPAFTSVRPCPRLVPRHRRSELVAPPPAVDLGSLLLCCR